MARWYFVENGQARGPLSEDAVHLAIKDGRLGPVDLIFQEGSEKWLPAREAPEFKDLFKAREQSPAGKAEWVLLRKKPRAQGVGFVQSGPFTVEQVRQKLDSGEADYADHIWKEGMSSWCKIVDLKEFSQVYKTVPAEELEEHTITNVPLQAEVPGEELLKNVMQGKLPERDPSWDEITADIPPLEAQGPDLTREAPEPKVEQAEAPVAMVSPEQQQFVQERESRQRVESPQATPERPVVPTPPVVVKRERLQDEIKTVLPKAVPSLPVGLFLSIVAIIFLGTGGWLVYSSLPAKKKLGSLLSKIPAVPSTPSSPGRPPPEPVVAPPTEPPSAVVAAPPVETAPPAPTPPPAPEPPKPKEYPKVDPTYIRIVPKNLTGADAEIVFETDGSHHYPVDLLLTGEAGKILVRRSYWRKWSVRTGPEKVRNVVIANLQLGEGTYRLEAKIGEKSARSEFFVGRRGADFNNDLGRHRKGIALFHQRERRRLFQTASRLRDIAKEFETQAQKLGRNRSGWNRFYGDWSSRFRKAYADEMKIGPASVGGYVYPQAWMDLKDLYGELDQSCRKLHSQMDGKGIPELSEVKKLQGQFSREVLRAMEQSLWK